MLRSTANIFASSLLVMGALACSNPADNVPSAAVTAATETTEAAETSSGTGQVFQIAEGSTVSFTGSKVTGSHDGGFHGVQGEITLVDGDPTRSTVHLVIDTTTLWADDDRLTGHLKSADFFDVENHPTATFTSTEIVPTGDGYTVTGNLDLHGITKSISFPARIVPGSDQVTAQTEFSIMRFDFDIVYPGKTDDLIRDEVVIKFDLVALPAGKEGA